MLVKVLSSLVISGSAAALYYWRWQAGPASILFTLVMLAATLVGLAIIFDEEVKSLWAKVKGKFTRGDSCDEDCDEACADLSDLLKSARQGVDDTSYIVYCMSASTKEESAKSPLKKAKKNAKSKKVVKQKTKKVSKKAAKKKNGRS